MQITQSPPTLSLYLWRGSTALSAIFQEIFVKGFWCQMIYCRFSWRSIVEIFCFFLRNFFLLGNLTLIKCRKEEISWTSCSNTKSISVKMGRSWDVTIFLCLFPHSIKILDIWYFFVSLRKKTIFDFFLPAFKNLSIVVRCPSLRKRALYHSWSTGYHEEKESNVNGFQTFHVGFHSLALRLADSLTQQHVIFGHQLWIKLHSLISRLVQSVRLSYCFHKVKNNCKSNR